MAHRGASAEAPENTLAAFSKALAYRAAWVELDVQLSRDGVPVVIHDAKVDRTTNGQGRVKELTLKELKRLDAGSWFSGAYSGEPIPTLEEVLQLVKGKAKVNIELKQAANYYPGLEERAIRLIDEQGMVDDVVITSFDQFSVQKVKRIYKTIKTGIIVSGGVVDLVPHALYLGVDCLSMAYPFITAQLYREARQFGLKMIAWTVDDMDEMARLKRIGKIMICTNNPQAYARYKKGIAG
jgi:glycerophosphoryl diester phosphodiesterase